MSIENVKAYLETKGFANRVREFNVSSATVELAAKALGVEEARIAKTLSFMTAEGPILIVCAGDTRIDNPKYKALFHQKAKMLSFDEAVELIGHAPGGVCPFALREGVRAYLDESLKRFDIIYPAAGTPQSAVQLTPDELASACQFFSGWIDVTKLPTAE